MGQLADVLTCQAPSTVLKKLQLSQSRHMSKEPKDIKENKQ